MRTKLQTLKKMSGLALLNLVPLASAVSGQSPYSILPGPKPADIPAQWKPWIGEYGESHPTGPLTTVYVLSERDGYFEILQRTKSSDSVGYANGERFRAQGTLPNAHGFRNG